MRPHVVCFAIALVSDLGMFALGRWTRQTPSMLHETEKTATADDQVSSAAAEHATAVSAGDTQVVKWRTRTVYRKDGSVAATVFSAERSDAKETRSEATSREVKTNVVEHVSVVTRDKTVIQIAHPRWSLGVSASRGLDGRMGYGPTAGLRILGPVWLTGGVDVGTKSATVGLSVAF